MGRTGKESPRAGTLVCRDWHHAPSPANSKRSPLAPQGRRERKGVSCPVESPRTGVTSSFDLRISEAERRTTPTRAARGGGAAEESCDGTSSPALPPQDGDGKSKGRGCLLACPVPAASFLCAFRPGKGKHKKGAGAEASKHELWRFGCEPGRPGRSELRGGGPELRRGGADRRRAAPSLLARLSAGDGRARRRHHEDAQGSRLDASFGRGRARGSRSTGWSPLTHRGGGAENHPL